MSDRQPLPTCSTCRFWDEIDEGVTGACMRYPPGWRPHTDKPDTSCPSNWGHPYTYSEDGCGEHQPATVAEPVGWSEDPPSVPGWYWYYHRSLASPLVCRVYTTPKNVWAEWGGGRRSNVKHWSGQWLPIITPTVADTPPAGT